MRNFTAGLQVRRAASCLDAGGAGRPRTVTFSCGGQNLEEARADRELHFLTLQRLKEECARISPTEPTGPTSKDIVKAIQTAVQNENGEDSPLSLELFADALRTDERVAKLLRARSEAQKQSAIEAVEALIKAFGASEEVRPISHSVIFDLFFSPEAETEKLLTIMQKTQTSRPSWTLDHKAQNRALKTLESSLQAKLTEYRTREAALSEELSQVRAQLAERDAREQTEMELLAACAAAQRERNAVKEQQKVMLDRNKALRQSMLKGAVLPRQPAMLTSAC